MAASLLIRNVRQFGADSADIPIRDGIIVSVGKYLSADGAPAPEAAGRLALPDLVEAHTHLDKSLLGPTATHGGYKGGHDGGKLGGQARCRTFFGAAASPSSDEGKWRNRCGDGRRVIG